MTPKEKASAAMSRYIRLRDAVEYCKGRLIDLSQFYRPEDIICKCCTCGQVKSWIYMDGGHFISKGSGGGSGVYFDERNVHCQCKTCNGFNQGRAREYTEFMLLKYGQEVIDELHLKDKIPLDCRDLAMKATEGYYKERYKELVLENGL